MVLCFCAGEERGDVCGDSDAMAAAMDPAVCGARSLPRATNDAARCSMTTQHTANGNEQEGGGVGVSMCKGRVRRQSSSQASKHTHTDRCELCGVSEELLMAGRRPEGFAMQRRQWRSPLCLRLQQPLHVRRKHPLLLLLLLVLLVVVSLLLCALPTKFGGQLLLECVRILLFVFFQGQREDTRPDRHACVLGFTKVSLPPRCQG